MTDPANVLILLLSLADDIVAGDRGRARDLESAEPLVARAVEACRRDHRLNPAAWPLFLIALQHLAAAADDNGRHWTWLGVTSALRPLVWRDLEILDTGRRFEPARKYWGQQ